MFGAITERFRNLKEALAGKGKLTEELIASAIKEVRLALLDADVAFPVVSKFIKRLKVKALGEDRVKGMKAGDQFISLVHKELIDLMGEDESKIHLKSNPTKIQLVGLQGAGKTTVAAKLALYVKEKHNKNPVLVACDTKRPAAILQLRILGDKIGVPVFILEGEKDPIKVVKEALKLTEYDLLIFDTAGRQGIDEELMDEAGEMKALINPHEVFFVANSALGQDAVNAAKAFDERVQITGSILTMLDSTARAGSAISILEVTGKPLLFEGVGENVEDFQVFNPHSMADRILGMGDIINLSKKMEDQMSKDLSDDDKKNLEKKIRKASFSFDDYLKQMKMMKKMGPMKGIMKMLPGMDQMPDMDGAEDDMKRIEAIIFSMTPIERSATIEFEPMRRRRIAKGSGTSVDDVNKLLKTFKQSKKMAKKFSSMKNKFGKGDLKGLPF